MTLDECAKRWAEDFPAYCRSALQVMNKHDEYVPFVLNPVQEAIYATVQEMLAGPGSVWLLILKARQMGVSTFVAALYFWLMHLTPKGRRAYLLAHEDDAAKKITSIYHRYWEQHPQPLRRARSRASSHELGFVHGGGLESGTASTPSGGRGGTVSLYHGSEVAFWTHYAAHSAGSMQQVSKKPGSMMILESTANGPVGGFYERWRNAELGRGRFRGLFFPWTFDPEYQDAVPHGFSLSREPPNEIVASEHDYQAEHGCTMEQMAWRRDKIQELSADGMDGALLFTQEYPITAREAFLQTSGRSLLSPAQVEAARVRTTKLEALDYASPLILGLDPATGHGRDASALVFRRGFKQYRIDRRRGMDAFQLTDYVYAQFCEEEADRLCIDTSDHTGKAVYAELMRRAQTAGKCIRVEFGGRPSDRQKWYNKRAEIWWRMATWIADGGAIVDEHNPDGQTLASELLSVETKHGNERVIQLEAKADVTKRLGWSPDGADALACTFAQPDPSPHASRMVVAPFGGELADDMAPKYGNVPHRGPDDFVVAPLGGGL